MTQTRAIVTSDATDLTAIVQLVTDGLTSDLSRIAYTKALTDFLAWYQDQGRPGLTKGIVQRYKTILQDQGFSPSTINQRLSAIRKLATEASDNQLIDPSIAAGVSRVKGVKSAGVRSGNWLTKRDAQRLLNTPDITTLKGLRDRAILAVMLGAGLRRSEVATLTFDHVRQRDGRWVIVDLVGKGNRVRSVPIPSWTKAALDEWTTTANITSGRLFRRINKGDQLVSASMTDQAVADVVKLYAGDLGFQLAAHDLRRSYAKLAHKGGAALDQIQLTLGHASLKTTERYLGIELDLTDAPADHLGLRLDWS